MTTGPGETLPAVDFPTFVLSLGHSALMHLGLASAPDGTSSEVNLPLARQTIDLLSLLEEKTKGNLSVSEARLLDQLVTDLRLHFVEVSKRRS